MELPLFMLHAVLFPGAHLPLHVFEERYKQLVAECLESGRPFGVLLIRRGREVGETAEPHAVGTTARITRVERLPEGRLNIVCRGEQRFRIARLLPPRPYPAAEAELLTDEAASPAAWEAAAKAAALFGEYLRLYLGITHQWARPGELPAEPGRLADYIAARTAVDLLTKQRLLEELSPARRLGAFQPSGGRRPRFLCVARTGNGAKDTQPEDGGRPDKRLHWLDPRAGTRLTPP